MIVTKYQQQEGKQQEEDKQEHLEIQDPLTAFMYGLKAPETKRQWPRRLKIFLDYLILDGTFEQKAFYDSFHTLRYNITRNRLAAGIAFVSGVLLLLSGYKATLEIYQLITQQIILHTSQQFWIFLLIPLRILAVLSQLGGITVLIGAGLFAINRVNIGKFLLSIGTGQGMFTVAFDILSEITSSSSGRLTFGNHYVIWLTSSMAGIGILFAITAQSFSKGKSDSIISKVFELLGVRKLLLIIKNKM